MRPMLSLLLVLLLPFAAGCPAPDEADPGDDDDATEEEEHDEEHEHGTGDLEGHVHALLTWSATDEIVLGTHTGMFRTAEGEDELVAVYEGPDFMGLVHDPFDADRYWASGHWGAEGLGNWGFAESTDGGATWENISLTGSVDFHQMATSPDQEGLVVGRFGGQFHVSEDSGRTWTQHGSPTDVYDIEVDEASGPELLVATGSALLRYDVDGGTSDTLLTDSVTCIDRVQSGYGYGTDDGRIFLCSSSLADCEEWDGPDSEVVLHLLGGADAASLYVLTSASEVHHTDDGGVTWERIAHVE
jgi:photosystem II stability/assembly factor-like uncharacterized protein